MLLVQQFIKDHGLAELTARFAVAVKRHPVFPSLVMLTYSQINSPMTEPVVQQCRGIILDEANDWAVVSYPFDKFFNYGEPTAAPIDWSTAAVQEKLDGSLMTLYWHGGAWQVASNRTPDAGGYVDNNSFTFAELFWKTFKAMRYKLPPDPSKISRRICFMFELATEFNRVVVIHKEPRLILIGARDLTTLQELPAENVAAKHGFQCVRSYPLQSLEDCIKAAAAVHGIEGEGFVVRDATFRRIKIKSPHYVSLSYMKEHLTERGMLNIIRANESTEFLSYFPELQPLYDQLKLKYDSLCGAAENAFEQIRNIEQQKDFAREALKSPHASVLFALRSGKSKNAREFFAAATPQLLERSIGLKVSEEPTS